MQAYFRTLLRDTLSELLYLTRLTTPSYANKHCFTVVTFHRVLPQAYLELYPLKEIAVTPEELEWFLSFFSKHFQSGPLDEIFALWNSDRGKTQRPLLAITFDDGQLDNFFYAKPVLDAMNIRATFFISVENTDSNRLIWHDRFAYAALVLLEQDIKLACQILERFDINTTQVMAGEISKRDVVVGLIEKVKLLSSEKRLSWLDYIENSVQNLSQPIWDGMMSWEQLRQLVSEGHEVGSHSMSHSILPLCDDIQLEYEIKASRRYLQEHLGTPVYSFCYPNGNYDYRVLEMVQHAGYHQAVTTCWGPNRVGVSPLVLRRCDIQSQHNKTRTGRLSSSQLAWRLSSFHPRVRACG